MIEDEKSLISVEEFRTMFFTFFKGEFKANLIYEKLLPHILVCEIDDKIYNDSTEMKDPNMLLQAEKMVSIQKLSIFIDSFNFSPIQVNKIHYKNTSTDMTYVMSSNTQGNLAEPTD